ncbi:MAG TPA: multidrug effflux MFS transporter [Azonexus sp.]
MSPGPAAAAPSFRLAALLTTLVALGPLSTDLYLPSLPTLATVFATDAARVQLTLSVYLAGFAVAQLAYGALSDRFGRRPLMLGGLLLYFLASLGCLLAPSIELLIAARFVQAVGACAGPVLGRAIVRDVWGPVEAVRVLAYVSGAMAVAPLLGPTLGGYLTVWFGWQANFVLLAVFSALQLAAVRAWLAESNRHRDPAATQPRRILGNFRRLLGDRNYVGYLLALTFSYSALFAFISGSAFVLIGRFALSPQAFGLCFGLVVAGYLSGSLLSGRLVRRHGGDRLLLAGGGLGAVAGAAMLGLELAGTQHLAAVLAPMFFVTVAVGLVMSNAVGQALAPYPQMAGAASSLMGFCQMGIAAVAGSLVGHGLDAAPTVLPMTVAGCALLVPLSFLALVRHRPA